MPGKPIEEPRAFDMRGGILWEQRIEKEERALLLMDKHGAAAAKQRRQQKRRTDNRFDDLEAKLLGKSPSAPAAVQNQMYSSGQMPGELRALQRMGVQHQNLMQLRQAAPKDGVVAKMRLRQVIHDADFGTRKVVEYIPEFYCEPEGTDKKVPFWDLPAAGAKHPSKMAVHPVDQRKARMMAEAAAAAAVAEGPTASLAAQLGSPAPPQLNHGSYGVDTAMGQGLQASPPVADGRSRESTQLRFNPRENRRLVESNRPQLPPGPATRAPGQPPAGRAAPGKGTMSRSLSLSQAGKSIF